jgi:hypothetical protein
MSDLRDLAEKLGAVASDHPANAEAASFMDHLRNHLSALARLDELRAERDMLQLLCAEAYQAVGSMLSDLGQFDSEKGQKLMDNLSQHERTHDDVLPWPSFELSLKNPNVVHLNMLNGGIAKPTPGQIKHLYPELFPPDTSDTPEADDSFFMSAKLRLPRDPM